MGRRQILDDEPTKFSVLEGCDSKSKEKSTNRI